MSDVLNKTIKNLAESNIELTLNKVLIIFATFRTNLFKDTEIAIKVSVIFDEFADLKIFPGDSEYSKLSLKDFLMSFNAELPAVQKRIKSYLANPYHEYQDTQLNLKIIRSYNFPEETEYRKGGWEKIVKVTLPGGTKLVSIEHNAGLTETSFNKWKVYRSKLEITTKEELDEFLAKPLRKKLK